MNLVTVNGWLEILKVMEIMRLKESRGWQKYLVLELDDQLSLDLTACIFFGGNISWHPSFL